MPAIDKYWFKQMSRYPSLQMFREVGLINKTGRRLFLIRDSRFLNYNNQIRTELNPFTTTAFNQDG